MKVFLRPLLGVGLLGVSATSAGAEDRPRIVAVNYPLQYFAERLLDDTAEVLMPVPADVDPSFWRPSIADISMIQSADLILLNGAGFATWVDRVSLPRSKLTNTAKAFEDQFIVTESITHSHGDGGEHSHEGLASYTWLDPLLASMQAEAVADAIISRGLADAQSVNARLATLQADLAALDQQARASLAGLQGVAMIATHPRYQYLAQRYNLSIISLEWEAGVTPNEAQIADLRALVADSGARVLIWEAAPPAEAREVASGLGLQNVVFSPLAHGPEENDFVGLFSRSLALMSDVSLS